MMQVKILRAWLKNRRHTNIARWLSSKKWRPWRIIRWTLSSSSTMHNDSDDDDYYIPKDVPKGHLAVYVGESQMRFIINVELLKYHLFNALLEQAQEEYGFTTTCRLYIPCDEDVFLNVVCCATTPQKRRFTFCL